MNIDCLLKYKRTEDENYYSILGCDETSTTDQILAEYKALSLIYHPDKNPDDENAVNRFQKIVKAKEVLIDSEKRAIYDKWFRSGFCMPFEKFLNLNKAGHTSVHWVNKKKDLMLDGCCNEDAQDTQSQMEECTSSKGFCQNLIWERDPACDLLKKFRNYEI